MRGADGMACIVNGMMMREYAHHGSRVKTHEVASIPVPMPLGGLWSASDAGTDGSRRVARPRSSPAMAWTGAQRVEAKGGALTIQKTAVSPTGRDSRHRRPAPERTPSGTAPEGGSRATSAPRPASTGIDLGLRSGTGQRGCRRPLTRGAAPVACQPGRGPAPHKSSCLM